MAQTSYARLGIDTGAILSKAGAALRHRLIGLSAREVEFSRRGFYAGVPALRERLEGVGRAFVSGYNAGLTQRSSTIDLERELTAGPPDLHGFAYEGAAMSLALVDTVAPWVRSRWPDLLQRAPQHAYLILVGAGWAMARLRRRALPRSTCDTDPTLIPLIWDGYGFHEGFFHSRRSIRRRIAPRLSGYARKAFDQGLGRSLWFVEGGSPARIHAVIAAFSPARRPDLWSGVGLACAYAGGFDDGGIAALQGAAGAWSGEFAQGVAFAAAARVRAGYVNGWTERACLIACGGTAADAARAVDEELQRAREVVSGADCYAAWQRALRRRFAGQGESHG